MKATLDEFDPLVFYTIMAVTHFHHIRRQVIDLKANLTSVDMNKKSALKLTFYTVLFDCWVKIDKLELQSNYPEYDV